MTIQPTNAIEPIANYPMIIEGKSSIFDEVDELIKQYDAKPLERAEIATSAKQLIERFNQLVEENLEQNLPLARDGLCRLLKINIEDVQLQVIHALNLLFRVNDFLSYDVKNNQIEQFIELEKETSEIIVWQFRSPLSDKLLLPLLNLYVSILERLWLVSRLTENQSNSNLILEKNEPLIQQVNQWVDLFSKKKKENKEVKASFNTVRYLLKTMISPSSYLLKKMDEFKNKLNSFSCATFLGDIYRESGNGEEAVKKYKKSLDFIFSLKKNNSIEKKELEDAEKLIWSRLKDFYAKWRNNHQDIEYYEKKLQTSQEINNQARVGQCYGCLGSTYLVLKDYKKSIEYQEKKLKIAEEINDPSMSAIAYREIGKTYTGLRNFDKAIEYYEKCLQIAQENEEWKEIRYAYVDLAIVYNSLAKYQKAIEFYEKYLQIAEDFKDICSIGRAYSNIGLAYYSLEKYRKAIEYHEKHLQIAQELEDRLSTGRAYENIGNTYYSLREYRKAMNYHKKNLQIVQELEDLVSTGKAYCNLGVAYYSLVEYPKAIECYEKSLKIARELEDRVIISATYSNLGSAYESLGEYHKAIEYHEKFLQIAQEIKDKASIARAYDNLGIAYKAIGEHRKAIDYHKESLKIAQEIKYRLLVGRAYCNLGITYKAIGKYRKVIDYHEKYLHLCQDLEDKAGIGSAYCNLGNGYKELGDVHKAIEYYEKYLQITQELEDKSGVGGACDNLGAGYKSLGDISKAEAYLHQSIDIYSTLQYELGNNSQWQISIFERQVHPYVRLERLLLEQNSEIKALEITEARRARALISSASIKFAADNTSIVKSSLTIDQIQKLAQNLQTNFVVYSLSLIEKEEDPYMAVWVIPNQGEIIPYQLSWDKSLSNSPSTYLSQQLQSLVKEVENLSSIKRGNSDELDFDLDDLEAELALLNNDPEVEKLAASKQTDKNEKDQNALKKLKQEKLRPWYDLLIAPLESALPAHGSSITIIPDGVLSQFPFGAFCDKQDTYLIEKYAISLAPSIKTLQLLHQLPQDYPSMSLVVGSPDTGNPKDQLEVADREAQTVATLINGSQLLSKKQATISHVSQQMQEARFIHLACHGLAEKKYDKHSVFEGLFKLAPDESDSKGELYAQQIAALNLKAELVFLSACYSGKGNVKQEGSIGPVWSFLGAGAKSTVATYWPLPDSATTFEMVESFYKAIQTTDRASLNKAQVLRQVTLKAMEKNRDDFIQWGAFFLSGVSSDAKLD